MLCLQADSYIPFLFIIIYFASVIVTAYCVLFICRHRSTTYVTELYLLLYIDCVNCVQKLIVSEFNCPVV